MVKCSIHQDRDAIAICQSCGNALCSDCRITIAGIAYCQPCLDVGRIRPPTAVADEAVDRLPIPLGHVIPRSRRNFNIGILGLAFMAIFIHAFWMFSYIYPPYFSSLYYATLIPRTIGVILVALGISLSAFGWMEFKGYFNFRWAFYIALFTLTAPWFGVLAELLVYTGQVMIVTPPYGSISPGPLCGLYNGLVLQATYLLGFY